MGIRTSLLDEKRTAFQMLRIYIDKLQGHLAPYLDKIRELMLEHLNFVFDYGGFWLFIGSHLFAPLQLLTWESSGPADVRSTAASCLPLLMKSYASVGNLPAVSAMWHLAAPALIDRITKEYELESLSWEIEAFKDCLDIVGENIGTEPVFQYMPVCSPLLRVSLCVFIC